MNADAAPGAPPRRRALTTIFVTVLLDLIGFGMILPLLPYYAQELHASAFQIGLLFSSYSLAQLVFAPLLGRLSDRTGRRPVLFASISGSVAAYLLFTAAGSFSVLLLARTLAGVAAANYAIAQAYIADVSSRENRAKAMGLVGAAFGLGFVLGPALGGLLAHLGEGTRLGNRIVPLTAAVLSAVNLLIAFSWLPESLPAELKGRSRQGSWLNVQEFRAVWSNGPLRGLMLLFFLVIFCFSIMEATLALFCQARFGFGETQTGLLFAFVGIVLVVVQGGLLGRLVQRFGERGLILSGILLMAAGLVLLPFTPVSRPLAGTALFLLLGSLALLAV
ncbi:MAG: MFS transporter, partial [Thermoanaerobaculia bacterium]